MILSPTTLETEIVETLSSDWINMYALCWSMRTRTRTPRPKVVALILNRLERQGMVEKKRQGGTRKQSYRLVAGYE